MAVLVAGGASGLMIRMRAARLGTAGRGLFLTRSDLPPLLVLMVALTGRNGETVKELPAAHRLLDGRAAGVSIIKRRRGPGHWSGGQAFWEIGPPGRRMHTRVQGQIVAQIRSPSARVYASRRFHRPHPARRAARAKVRGTWDLGRWRALPWWGGLAVTREPRADAE